MSVIQMAKVFRSSTSEGAARLVLLALADVAADDGKVTAYKRSHSILAAKANCAEGTVRRSIAKLVELGEVVVLDAGGGRKSASYQITLERDPAPDEGGPDDGGGGTRRAGTPRQMNGHPAPDEHPVSPSMSTGDPSPSIAEPLALEIQTEQPTFAAFWSVYPRHVDRARAEQAWSKSLKLASASMIVAGAERYRDETAGRPVDKIAHPTTWLNGQRWTDEPGANATRTPPPPRGARAPVTAPRDGQAGRVQL